MKYCTAYIWEQGKRTENEDSLALLSVNIGKTPLIMAVVADGIGSLYKSENASSYVTYSLKKAFEEATHTNKCFNLRYIKRLLCRTISRCHIDIKNMASNGSSRTGTTCSLVVLVGRKGFLINIGDSRIYKVGKKLLTRDDTHNRMLMRCIGTGSYHRPHTKKFRLKNNEMLLLATDGFYKRLHKTILTTPLPVVSEECMQAWLSDRYNTAVVNGETDNSSAILIAKKDEDKKYE